MDGDVRRRSSRQGGAVGAVARIVGWVAAMSLPLSMVVSPAAARPARPALTMLPDNQVSGGNPPGTMPVTSAALAADPNNPLSLISGGEDQNCTSGLGFYTAVYPGPWTSSCMDLLTGA